MEPVFHFAWDFFPFLLRTKILVQSFTYYSYYNFVYPSYFDLVSNVAYMYYLAVSEIKVFVFTQSLFWFC